MGSLCPPGSWDCVAGESAESEPRSAVCIVVRSGEPARMAGRELGAVLAWLLLLPVTGEGIGPAASDWSGGPRDKNGEGVGADVDA